MNIHFKNTELKKQLEESKIEKFIIGSVLYGTQDEDSDEDFLIIYNEGNKNNFSFLWEHHQLQFKENNCDYIFTTLQNFIRNILTGDSTINFELLFSKQVRDSSLNFLYKLRHFFIGYNVMNSYIGLAKRDLKFAKKILKTGNQKELKKRISHVFRGVMIAEDLVEGNTYKQPSSSFLRYIRGSGFSLKEKKKRILDLEGRILQVKQKLNKRLEKGKIARTMRAQDLKVLDGKVRTFLDGQNKKEFIDYGTLFCRALAEGISY